MKKLFSYLLISSMVVLSSCTNYDDQFDDLNTQINTLKTQIEGFSSLSSGLTALQGTVASLQTAINNIPVTPATDISGLEASLTSLAAEVKALQTSLASAATAAEVAALQTALTAAQSDLTELLAANNVYTGNLVINSASTLAAAEAQGGKLGIVNGDVYITQSSTAIDAAKLQTVVSKMVTVIGAVSYTHSGTGVTAVNFDKLTGAGSIKLDQEAPVSLTSLVSVGALEIVEDVKLTSIDLSALTSVTSFNDGTNANALGGSKVTSIDLGSLPRYDVALGALALELSTSGDTTLDLALLTTTDNSTGLVEKLDLTVTGGDDLSLPLFVKGDISATNVKSLVLPKFIYTGSTDGDLTVTASKLESIAMHEVRGSFSLASASKLASVDFIGTIDTSVTERSVGGSITISGTNPSLTTASFAGILAGASITGATDLTSLTTTGMIRAFTLDGSDDITTLTLGHKNITGITGTNGENAGNASALTIQNNAALTSFVASELTSLGTLIVKNNPSLTAFTLKSTLSLGTALSSAGAAASETVNVDISGNELTGSVQRASANNVSPAVTGKITQASLNSISTYLKAVEAAIKHGDLTTAAGADATGWDRTTGLYTASVTSGGANTGYSLTKANVVIDEITANLSAAGVDAGASSNYNVIAVTTPGVGIAAAGLTQAKATEYWTRNTGVTSLTVAANGASVQGSLAAATWNADLDVILTDTEFASYGVELSRVNGLNKRVKITQVGTYSDTSDVSISWTDYNVSHTITATTAVASTTAEVATTLAAVFNAYNAGTASATVTDAIATASGDDILIFTGTYSGTDFKIDIDSGNYFPGLTFAYDADDATNPSFSMTYSQLSDDGITITATSSSTATTAAALNTTLAITGVTESNVLTPTTASANHPFVTTAYLTDSGKYLNDYSVSTPAVSAVAANITMRATWL